MDAAALATSYTATETKLARGEVGINLDAARELYERFQSQYQARGSIRLFPLHFFANDGLPSRRLDSHQQTRYCFYFASDRLHFCKRGHFNEHLVTLYFKRKQSDAHQASFDKLLCSLSAS
jgi:hypothetical protein